MDRADGPDLSGSDRVAFGPHHLLPGDCGQQKVLAILPRRRGCHASSTDAQWVLYISHLLPHYYDVWHPLSIATGSITQPRYSVLSPHALRHLSGRSLSSGLPFHQQEVSDNRGWSRSRSHSENQIPARAMRVVGWCYPRAGAALEPPLFRHQQHSRGPLCLGDTQNESAASAKRTCYQCGGGHSCCRPLLCQGGRWRVDVTFAWRQSCSGARGGRGRGSSRRSFLHATLSSTAVPASLHGTSSLALFTRRRLTLVSARKPAGSTWRTFWL